MTDMAKLLAQRGVISKIVTTPLNAIRLIPIINRAIESGLPIRLLQLQLPLHEAGLQRDVKTWIQSPRVP